MVSFYMNVGSQNFKLRILEVGQTTTTTTTKTKQTKQKKGEKSRYAVSRYAVTPFTNNQLNLLAVFS